MRELLHLKLHHVCVTEANVQYEGSFGIDREIMNKVGLYNFEAIEIYNITNGARLKTYAIPLPAGSKRFESNGAAAHLVRKGDCIILASYAQFTDAALQKFKGPMIALMDFPKNTIKKLYQPDRQKADGSGPLEEFDTLQHGRDRNLALHPTWI